MRYAVHLARRFFGSLSRRPPDPADVAWAEGFLLPHEVELWRRHVVADQRHTIAVARRFVGLRPQATRAEVAGALLHDIGKLDSDLGTMGRVVARVVGPRTARLRTYLDHERLGAERLAAAGSDPATVELVNERGPAYADLYAADNI